MDLAEKLEMIRTHVTATAMALTLPWVLAACSSPDHVLGDIGQDQQQDEQTGSSQGGAAEKEEPSKAQAGGAAAQRDEATTGGKSQASGTGGTPIAGGATVRAPGAGAADSDSGGSSSSTPGSDVGGSATASGGSSPTGAGAGGAPATAGSCVNDGQIVITDDTNYSFASTLTVESTTVKDATNLLFDWSQLSTDLRGRWLDPLTDIDVVTISLWRMTATELAERVAGDSLPLAQNLGVLTSYPEDSFTSAHLLEFNNLGSEVPEEEIWARFDTSHRDYAYPPEYHTFMLTAGAADASGQALPGENTRMLAFFRLDPASTNTTVSLTDASTVLDYAVDFASLEPVQVPTSVAELTIDWSQMIVNALGNEYDVTQITNAVVARYAITLGELEQRFLFMEESADAWYEGDVLSGTSIDLSMLTNEAGATFPGINGKGLWLVALRCTASCNNPAPWSITLLRPCP